MAEKVLNYTPEQTQEMVAAYVANPTAETVAEFAEKFGKTVKSIVAKLAKEKVYIKKEYTTKTGEKPVKKDTHADAIGNILRLSDGETDSLTKANKPALIKIFNALANSIPLEAETPEELAGKNEAINQIAEFADLTDAECKSLSRTRGAVLAKVANALNPAKSETPAE